MSEQAKDTLNERGDNPDMPALFEEYDNAWANDDAVDSRLAAVEAVRYARWKGQNVDGLQHEQDYDGTGRSVLWEGASDARILLVDDLINGLVDLMATAFAGAQMKTSPVTVKTLSAEQTGELWTVLNWLKEGPLAEQLADNVEISAQFTSMVGWCVLHPRWERRPVAMPRKVTMEMVNELAAEAQARTANATPTDSPSPRPSPAGRGGPAGAGESQNLLTVLPQMVMDPEMTDQCAELFTAFFPDVSKADAKKHVKALREEGETTFTEVHDTSVGPKIDVLCPWYHFILPSEATARPGDARVRFVRMLLPKWRVDELAAIQGWDNDAFVTALKNAAGTFQEPPTTKEDFRDLNQNLCEVVWAFRQVFEDGARRQWCTVMSPQVRPTKGDEATCIGKNWEIGTVTDDIFVYCRREATDWCVTDTRGIPDVAAQEQRDMKNFRDAIYDYTQLSVTPPIQRVGTAASAIPPAFGPWALIESPNTTRQWEPLRLTEGADVKTPATLQEALRKEAEDRVGLERADTVPARTVRRQQRLVGRFLFAWGKALLMSAVQAYQNMTTEELTELLGHAPVLDAETLAKHLVLMKYDVRTGDPAFLERLEKTITAILSAGLGNDLMLNKLVSWWLSLVDPNAAQEFVPQDQAPQRQAYKEARDELNNVMLGNKPMLVEKDPSAQAKLAAVKDLMSNNPMYQQALQHPEIKQNFETMMDNWQHSVQETVISKAQGRLGVKNV